MNSDATNFSSLIIEGTATGNITYNRWVNSVSPSSPSNGNQGWDLVGSPVLNGTLDPTTLATSDSNYAILPFDNSSSSNGSWTNTTSNATFTTSTGVGYAMAKTTAGTVAFTGIPNTFTNTDIAITNNTSGSGTHWNLVANPFPAYIALNGNAKGLIQVQLLHFCGIMRLMLMFLVTQHLMQVYGTGTVQIILLKTIAHLENYMLFLAKHFFIC